MQTYLAPSFLAQATVCEFLRRGLLDQNVARVSAGLRDRRDAMLESLERELPEGSSWSRPEGGYFVWLDFPAGTDAVALAAQAEQAGVVFVKGTDFFPDGAGGGSSARLAYSFVSPDDVRAGVARLAGLLREPRSAPVSV